MTNATNHHAETPASLLAPLARGLLRRAPDIQSLSIHDANGNALWSSSDFLLAEDYALIAEVVEDPLQAFARAEGLWWESPDTARARCSMPCFDGDHEFAGVVLAVFAGISTSDEARAQRVDQLLPVLPVLGKTVRRIEIAEAAAVEQLAAAGSETIEVAALRFDTLAPLGAQGESVETYEREEELLDLIDSALRDDEFALHLQPIVSLRDEEAPLIVEVLMRLPTEKYGVLAMHEFLDTAERNGRMPAIDRWVIRALLVWMQRNRDRWVDANAVFAVNLSGKSVVRPDFRTYLESCLDKSGLPLTSLRFEISEYDAGIAPQEFATLARSLAERGCEVSVDNAGTGTGRFDFLREIQADLLKIDGSLVGGASEDRVSRAVINGLVHMADTLGMRTVANQVDTTGKLLAMTDLGVDYAQGYKLREPEHIDCFDFLGCGCQRAPEARP
jgi:EAL domain-containing protein (putative c-di-GMP-specific phosphodiesterase class I)